MKMIDTLWNGRKRPRLIPNDEVLAAELQDPEFREEWERQRSAAISERDKAREQLKMLTAERKPVEAGAGGQRGDAARGGRTVASTTRILQRQPEQDEERRYVRSVVLRGLRPDGGPLRHAPDLCLAAPRHLPSGAGADRGGDCEDARVAGCAKPLPRRPRQLGG